MNLIEVLENLIPCIKGKWFIGDGALLGIVREGKLMDYDNDIDIYILEDTEIDLTNSVLKEQDYYLCKKIYNPNNKPLKINPWTDFIASLKPSHQNLNRPKLCTMASPLYKQSKIIHKFTDNHIDIFTIYKNKNIWELPLNTRMLGTFYNQDDLILKENNALGFPVYIPNNAEEVLERQYGKDWRIPNQNFKYY